MEISKTKSKVLDYRAAYAKDVLPIFNDFESVRINTLNEFKKKSFLKYWLPIIISLPLTILAFFNIDSMIIVAIVAPNILFSSIILCPILYDKARKKEMIKFANLMKAKTLQSLLKVFGDIIWVGHDASKQNLDNVLLTDDKLNQSGLFISYNTRYTDDEFEGTYKDVSFKISETKMLDIHDHGKSRTCTGVFEGVIISFKFNKKINNRTIIAPKGDLTKKSQTLISMLVLLPCCFELFKNGYAHWKLILALITLLVVFFIAKKSEKKEEALDEVLLEYPSFAKKFNVYSSDQVEARYLVTPAFMQRFYNLQTAFGADKAKCSFFGDTLMIAIKTNKNLFEICSLYKSLQDPTSIKEFYKELNSIYKMIEYFKLDEKTAL